MTTSKSGKDKTTKKAAKTALPKPIAAKSCPTTVTTVKP